MEIQTGLRFVNDACADYVVTEAFATLALLGVGFEQRRQCRHDRVAIYIAAMKLVKPGAFVGAAEIQIVETGRPPHEANLRHVRPSATVRTAGHANGYF